MGTKRVLEYARLGIGIANVRAGTRLLMLVLAQVGKAVEAVFPTGLPFAFSTLDEVATRCGSGVGDCGGGPIRMLFGDKYAWLGAVRSHVLVSSCPRVLVSSCVLVSWLGAVRP